MKRFFTCASLLILAIILFGCEGHVKTLYLAESEDVKTPWSFSSQTILIKSNKDVYSEVESIAAQLSLNKNPNQKHIYYLNNFFMYVTKKDNGLWEIGLKDWPDTSRSETSRKTEKLIREKLENK